MQFFGRKVNWKLAFVGRLKDGTSSVINPNRAHVRNAINPKQTLPEMIPTCASEAAVLSPKKEMFSPKLEMFSPKPAPGEP